VVIGPASGNVSGPAVPTPGVRRVVTVVIALTALWAVVNGLFQPLLPVYVTSIGGSATQVGIATAATAFAFMLVEPFWGLVSDRIGAARPLLVAKTISATVFAAFLLRSELWWVVLLQFVRGLTDVALAPIGRGLLAKHLPPGQRGTVMGLYSMTHNTGRNGMGFVGGGIVDGIGFRALFVVCAVLSLMGALLGYFGLRGLDRAPTSADPAKIPPPSPPAEHFVKRFVTLSIVTTLGHWGNGARTFVTLYAITAVGLSASEIGWLATLTGVVLLLLAVPGGRLCDRVGRKPVLAMGLGVSALVPIVVALDLPRSFAGLAVVAILTGVGFAASNPARQVMLSDVVPPGRQGLTFGIYGIAEDVGLLGGPLLGGLLWDWFSPAVTFAGFAFMYLAALGATIVALPETRPPLPR
jgi:MFS transporter, ACDE family, multidrug resistance protein